MAHKATALKKVRPVEKPKPHLVEKKKMPVKSKTPPPEPDPVEPETDEPVTPEPEPKPESPAAIAESDPIPVVPTWSGDDADFPAWVAADMRYKEQLSEWMSRNRK